MPVDGPFGQTCSPGPGHPLRRTRCTRQGLPLGRLPGIGRGGWVPWRLITLAAHALAVDDGRDGACDDFEVQLADGRLLAMQAESWRPLDQHYNRGRFAGHVHRIDRIPCLASDWPRVAQPPRSIRVLRAGAPGLALFSRV